MLTKYTKVNSYQALGKIKHIAFHSEEPMEGDLFPEWKNVIFIDDQNKYYELRYQSKWDNKPSENQERKKEEMFNEVLHACGLIPDTWVIGKNISLDMVIMFMRSWYPYLGDFKAEYNPWGEFWDCLI